MSLAGNVRELFTLIAVDKTLLMGEIIHLCCIYRNKASNNGFVGQIDGIKLRAGALLSNSRQSGLIITCECSHNLLRDLLGITQHEHYR
jgi:hypothetical protein